MSFKVNNGEMIPLGLLQAECVVQEMSDQLVPTIGFYRDLHRRITHWSPIFVGTVVGPDFEHQVKRLARHYRATLQGIVVPSDSVVG